MLALMETNGYNLWLIMENGKARILGAVVMVQYVSFSRANVY
jgi:hypothetical protein